MNKYDVIIIGAGVYGLELASYFKSKKKQVLVLEKEATAVSRSSYANQARVHRGYHYPRDTLTALRSRSSYKAFSEKYKECISHKFKHFYCIGDTQSLVTPKQFENFYHLGMMLSQSLERVYAVIIAPRTVKQLEDILSFNQRLYAAIDSEKELFNKSLHGFRHIS